MNTLYLNKSAKIVYQRCDLKKYIYMHINHLLVSNSMAVSCIRLGQRTYYLTRRNLTNGVQDPLKNILMMLKTSGFISH